MLRPLAKTVLSFKVHFKTYFYRKAFFFFYHKSAVDLASIRFVLHLFFMVLLYIGFLIIFICYVAFYLIVCSILCFLISILAVCTVFILT